MYVNYVHGIRNGNSYIKIPCLVTVVSYPLTINCRVLSFNPELEYLFLRCTSSQSFHPYDITVQQNYSQIINLNTALCTLTKCYNMQKSIAMYVVQQVFLRGLISAKHQFLCPAVISVIIISTSPFIHQIT